MNQGLSSDILLEIFNGNIDCLVEFALFVSKRSDLLVDAGNQDMSLRSDEFREECEEIGHRFVNHSAKDARVKVGARTRNVDREVSEATESCKGSKITEDLVRSAFARSMKI
jgi:hypothetical protein